MVGGYKSLELFVTTTEPFMCRKDFPNLAKYKSAHMVCAGEEKEGLDR